MKSSSCPGCDYAGIEAKAEWHLHVGLETEAFVSEFHLILTSRDFPREPFVIEERFSEHRVKFIFV